MTRTIMVEPTTGKTESIFHTIKVPQEISEYRVRGLLCGAFEGGSHYWACNASYNLRDGLTIQDFKEGGSEANKVGDYYPSIQLVPFVEGCSVTLEDCEEGTVFEKVLNRGTMAKGLDVMAEKYPRHFQNFINENDDCETSDVFLQCCLLGEIVFG